MNTTRRDITWPSTRQKSSTDEIETDQGLLTIKVILVTQTTKSITIVNRQTFNDRGDFRNRKRMKATSGPAKVSYELEISLPGIQPYKAEYDLLVPMKQIGHWLENQKLGSHSTTVISAVFRLQSELSVTEK